MGGGFWGTLSGERGVGATGAREEATGRMWAGLRGLGGELIVICPQPTRPPPPPSPTPTWPCTHSFTFNLLNDSQRHGSSPSPFRDEDTESQRG